MDAKNHSVIIICVSVNRFILCLGWNLWDWTSPTSIEVHFSFFLVWCHGDCVFFPRWIIVMESKLLDIVATSTNQSPFVWFGIGFTKTETQIFCVFGSSDNCLHVFIEYLALPWFEICVLKFWLISYFVNPPQICGMSICYTNCHTHSRIRIENL